MVCFNKIVTLMVGWGWQPPSIIQVDYSWDCFQYLQGQLFLLDRKTLFYFF